MTFLIFMQIAQISSFPSTEPFIHALGVSCGSGPCCAPGAKACSSAIHPASLPEQHWGLWSLRCTGGLRCPTASCLPEPRATESWATALVENPRSSWECSTTLQTGWVQKAAPLWWELWLFFSCHNMIEKLPPRAVLDHPYAWSKMQATQSISPVPT